MISIDRQLKTRGPDPRVSSFTFVTRDAPEFRGDGLPTPWPGVSGAPHCYGTALSYITAAFVP